MLDVVKLKGMECVDVCTETLCLCKIKFVGVAKRGGLEESTVNCPNQHLSSCTSPRPLRHKPLSGQWAQAGEQYHYSLSIIMILEILGIILVVVFYFKEEALADMGIYPEDTFKDAIIKYRDDTDMQNFIDNMQDVVSPQ
ncbi:tetraspanin [Elysia marginata]|uniref:Tetraspanin n=1 Tax=Elysia marginata TaxID=1093978 RepID=A0AAV4IAT9_9GAST|nr:tetraspanin [Elysia marginata]